MRLAKFIEYLEDRAGDSLRAVEWYRDDEAELIYLRDDLELDDVQPRADTIHALLTNDGDAGGLYSVEGLGERLASVDLFEEAVLVNLPAGDDYGVVVGLEPDASRSLHRFVTACRETVMDVEPPR